MALRRLVQTAFVLFAVSAVFIGLRGLMSAPAPRAERRVSLGELSRHAVPGDCWMAFAGGVYDVTTCVAGHPSPPAELTRWCGREATEAFETKGRSRPHSPAARAQLMPLRVGALIAP